MFIKLEPDSIMTDEYGRPRMAFLILFDQGEKLTRDMRLELDILRYMASEAWHVAHELCWQGPIQ